ncbi:uncharacterized protein ATC70_004021 [Mucor velutinosus]|uniref:MIT domain-containing protein n=1 Tax=Mucor velutinosus TaxID=708070 RepID=A0AAN7I4E7_9FUNG|nr:hypothetical protein ATC70_004021 [Mucor velutinosus]
MSILVSKVISQADRLPIISNASQWLPSTMFSSKKEEANAMSSSRRSSIEDYSTNGAEFYNTTSPRYSIAPPTYDNVVKEDTKRFANALSTIWKRASFSSAAFTNNSNDIKMSSATQQNTIDKKQMEHAITLINVATDMNNSGNQQMAIDLYMMGLDKLMSALPLEDATVKSALEKKITEMKVTHQLNIASAEELLDDEKKSKGEKSTSEDEPMRSQLSNLVINAAVMSAVALKKSPIPDAVSAVMNYAIDSMQVMDEKHQLRRRTWDLAANSVAKAVEIDRQYEIHQMVTGAFYTGFAAFIKAGVAYAETPGHQEASSNSSGKATQAA